MPLTAAQVVARACDIAKTPGWIVQAGQFLNLTLKDLWLHRDLKVNLKTQTIAIGTSTGPYNLEPDYQRTYDLFYLQNGLPYFLKPGTLAFFDMQFVSSGISNYPYLYATDLSSAAIVASTVGLVTGGGQIYVYPQSSAAITLTHRYMQQQAEISAPETSTVIPWFSDQDYLITATARRLMQVSDDARLQSFIENEGAMLRMHLIMAADDEQQIVKRVELDPWTFRGRRSSRPTKVTG